MPCTTSVLSVLHVAAPQLNGTTSPATATKSYNTSTSYQLQVGLKTICVCARTYVLHVCVCVCVYVWLVVCNNRHFNLTSLILTLHYIDYENETKNTMNES